MAAASSTPQYASLYVGDLHPDVTEAMLYEIFNAVGPVGSIRVCRDGVTRRSLGYAYVNYHSVQDAERAIDTLYYTVIKGRTCRVMWSQRDPSARKNAVGNIFVKNLDRNIENRALFDTFSLFGNILSCKVSCDPNGKSRGYGFVHFETEEAAKTAIERVNGMKIGDNTVEVTTFKKRTDRDNPKDNYTNLYIKNLPNDFSEDKLKEMFGACGSITSSCVMEDKQGRQFAFVNFETSESAKKAVEELHGKDMRTEDQKEKGAEDETDRLYVGRAMTKAERAREVGAKDVGNSSRAGVNLYIKNLSDDTDDSALRELFEPYGKITSVSVAKDDQSRCKGFGFVSFETPDEATKAVTEMHLKVEKGKPLYVGLAERREDREERLKQRYQGGKGGKDAGGKDGGFKGGFKGGFGGKGGKGGPMSPMGQMGGMCGPQFGQKGGMPGQMGPGPMQGMQGMMPSMMGMMGKGMMPMGGMGAMQGMMGGKGPMMGAPQMMSMMGKGGPMPPQMMAMMGGKGPMMPQMMQMPGHPGQPGPQPGQVQQQMPQMPQQPQQSGPLSAAALAAAPATVQKQMLGEKLFPAISRHQPQFAGKITGMMLEMDNSELLMLLESDDQLKGKINEAMRVIEGRGA